MHGHLIELFRRELGDGVVAQVRVWARTTDAGISEAIGAPPVCAVYATPTGRLLVPLVLVHLLIERS